MNLKTEIWARLSSAAFPFSLVYQLSVKLKGFLKNKLHHWCMNETCLHNHHSMEDVLVRELDKLEIQSLLETIFKRDTRKLQTSATCTWGT